MVSKNNPVNQPESEISNTDSQIFEEFHLENQLPDNSTNSIPVESQPVTPSSKTKNIGQFLWKALIFILNILLMLIIVGAISALFYFGWPFIYKGYIQPVNDHTAKIAQLEKDLVESNSKISIVQTQYAELNSNQPGVELTLSAINSKLDNLQNELDQHTNSIKSLEAIQQSIEISNKEDKSNMNSKLDQMISMEYLSRARLFLYQSNFGLAKQDIQQARNTLANIVDQAPKTNSLITEVIQRLDMCLSRLPDYPVPASGDLDIAWQLLGSQDPQINTATSTTIVEPITPTGMPSTPAFDLSTTPVPTLEATPTP